MSTGLAFLSVVEAISGSEPAAEPDEARRKFAADFGLEGSGAAVADRRAAARRGTDVFRNAGPELPAAMQAQLSAAQRREQLRT
jgi:hypothetical protein